MIPASIRIFSPTTVFKIIGGSRASCHRHGIKVPRMGADVVRHLQKKREMEGLPPLTEAEVADVFVALAAVEDVHQAELAAKAGSAKVDLNREVAA